MSEVQLNGGLVLIDAAEHVPRLQLYGPKCKELLDLAIENYSELQDKPQWTQFIHDLCQTIKTWSQVDDIDRLMQFDDITKKYNNLADQMGKFGISDATQHTVVGVAVNNEFLNTATMLVDSRDGLEKLKALPPAPLYRAMKLLQRAMNCVSPASEQYHNFHAALMRLQRADSTANLEAPDLTPHISDISDEPVAKGGFSDVYTGEWLRQGKVALKILRILGGSGANKRHKLFRKEVQLWHGLRHHHLLQFWGLCNTSQGLAMVSPFMSNGNAASYLAAHPEAGALGLLVGAAYGLEYLHTRQPPITHGDLRGANILVSSTGEACLADFGLSKIMEVASADSSLGMTTANAGATRWMAPELFRSEQSDYPPSIPDHASVRSEQRSIRRLSVDSKRNSDDRYEGVTPRSDVWAYGMTIYELMTGKVPYYHNKNSATVILAILRGEIPPDPKENDLRHDWKPQLLELMHECWAARPSMRPTMSTVSAKMRAAREARATMTQVPQSLLLAIDTPLSPVSPRAAMFLDEELADVIDEMYVVESPTSDTATGTQFAGVIKKPPFEFHLAPPPIPPSPPHRKKSSNRKSTTESTISQTEAKDTVPALPDLKSNVGTVRPSRPRSSSAPMAISISHNSTSPSASPTPYSGSMYRSANSSQVSMASASGQSKFSKPSRPPTPATPTPDESSSAPSSPVANRIHRISSFWKKTSIERVPPDALLSGDPLKTVTPILRRLIEGQESMLGDTYDATFSGRLRTAGPALVPLERIDGLLTSLLGGYIKLRRQHFLFLEALKTAERMVVSECVPSLRTLFSTALSILSAVYPKYAHGIYGVEEILDEEMERNFPFRAWLQASEEDTKLKNFLRKPIVLVENIFVSLSQLVAFAKLKSSRDTSEELKDLEQQLVALLMLTRLRKWQGAMGRDEVVYKWRQLVNRQNAEAFADEARQSAFFRLIETQMVFMRNLRGFHSGILKRIVQSPILELPHLQRIFTELTILIDLHSQYLECLHTHQAECHPILTDIVNITFDSVICWADHYSLYSSTLCEAIKELEQYSADIFPLVHATGHPLLANQDLATLLWLPINHSRRLMKSFHALLEISGDTGHDTKGIVEVVSTLTKLIELCDSLTSATGTSPQMRHLSTQLQWHGDEDKSLALDDPQRRIICSGKLLMPYDNSQDVNPDGYFVIILDNHLIITRPQMRWGLDTLSVEYCVPLENISILDLDSSNGLHDLYLLEGPEGETIAAPLPIRIETSALQKTLILLCLTTADAIEWRRNLATTKAAREQALEAFPKTILHRHTWVATVPFIPSCSASFVVNGIRYYVIGGQKSSGLWIRTENQQSLRQLMSGVSIRQCQVLSSLGVLLVLSGSSLISLKLEDLAVSKVSSRQLDTRGSVSFFRCGTHNQRTIVVAVISAPSSSATVRIYEIAEHNGSVKGRRISYFGIKESWSSLFKWAAEFTVQHGLHDIAIMDQSLMIMSTDGFQYVNTGGGWNDLQTVTFPVFRGLASSQTYDRCKTSKPIKAIRIKKLFLLCYADFGIYVNEQGLTQSPAIEWTSERVTHAASIAPHVFLAGRNGIETRLMHNGRLIDRLSGDEVAITQDQSTVDQVGSPGLHIAMKDREDHRQFELSDESYSVYEWITLNS